MRVRTLLGFLESPISIQSTLLPPSLASTSKLHSYHQRSDRKNRTMERNNQKMKENSREKKNHKTKMNESNRSRNSEKISQKERARTLERKRESTRRIWKLGLNAVDSWWFSRATSGWCYQSCHHRCSLNQKIYRLLS